MTRVVLSQTEFRKKFEEYINGLTPEQLKQHGEELQKFADKTRKGPSDVNRPGRV